MKEIAAALVSAQKNFAPALKKADNPYFGSKYADLAACIEAVLDSLNASGIALIQHTAEHDKGVVVSTVFLHESGEVYEAGSIFVPASQNTAQSFGSALTYARRYSLMAACGIAPEDDDGNAASRLAPRKVDEKDYWSSANIPPFAEDVAKAPEAIGNLTEPPICAHGHMILIEGVSNKTGQPYRGYKCPEKARDRQCEAIWMVKSKSTGEWRFKDGE